MGIFVVTINTKTEELCRELEKDSFTIGRGLDCDIPLNDFHVSRVHLIVRNMGEEIFIEDKNSSNGTYLNDNKIIAGTSVLVGPNDKVQLGRSEYILGFKLKPVLPEVPMYVPEPVAEDTVDINRATGDSAEVEQALHEAKIKAAQIVLEGEKQAEKRVQAIYQLANEKRDQAQEFYQRRVAEAHQEADAILLDFQNQGRGLLQEARNMAQEIRDEVDGYVRSLKEKASRETEEMLSKAKLAAEKMKSEAVEQGREAVRIESEEIQKKVKAKTEAFNLLSSELAEIEKKLSFSRAALDEVCTKEAEMRQKSRQEEERFRNLLQDEEGLLKEIRDKEESRLKNLVEKEGAKLRELQDLQKLTSDESERLENRVRGLQEKQVQLDLDVANLADKKDRLAKDYEIQKNILNENLENEKQKIAKSEQQYQEEVRIEISKRLQKIEQDFLDNLINKKELLVKKLFTVCERSIPSLPQDLETKLKAVVDEEIVTASKSTIILKKPVDLMKKREMERIRWVLAGFLGGACLLFVLQVMVKKISRDRAPVQTLVAAEAKQRQEELESRRFNPQQVEDIKDNYTDSVIYTKNFVQIYTDQQFQQSLYKEVSVYLLKTWRIDEDKAIQVLSVANALVKSLEEKRKQIHPDFVNDGIKKMHELEAETSAKMKDILGSEVRLESYRTFERDFFKSFQAKGN